jgi:hypothetical protein
VDWSRLLANEIAKIIAAWDVGGRSAYERLRARAMVLH